jgi:WD40 repeat protein
MGSPATAAATGVSSPPEKEANKESSYSSLMMDDDEEGSGAEQAMSKNKIKRKKEAKLASAAGQTTKTATGKRTGKNARASDSLRTRILPPVCILHPQGLADTAPPKNSSSAFSSIDSKGSLNGTGVDEADISIGIVPKQQHQSAVVPSTPTIHPLHTKPNTTSSPHASPPVMHVDKSLKERHEAALKRMRIEQEKKDLKSITQTHKGKKSAPATAISSGTSKAYASSTKQKDSKIKNSGAPSNVGSGPVPVTIASSDVVVTGKGKKKSSHKKKDVSASALPIAGPPPKRYQAVVMSFPQPVGGAVQLHPRDGCAGLACLEDGSLVLFRFPSASFNDSCVQQQASKSSPPVLRGAALLKQERDKVGKMYYLVKPSSSLEETIEGGGEDNQKKDESGNSSYFVTCAAFDKNGKQIYAVTKCGTLLGFSLEHPVMEALRTSSNPSPLIYIPAPEPMFRIKIPGGATARQVIVSRNGQLVLVNSADNALRLYNVEECWALTKTTANPIEPFSTLKSIVKPRFVFQDLVSKVPWACCDFSGDGEYVVGGCNSSSAQYELYLWNTATGALMDRLTGPQLSLHSISWHPTRAFIAVGTSDGLVDLWGPRMDWTAFAPDFQALPMNVEYIEREDEFDEVVDGEEKKETEDEKNLEDELVDVVSVERIPVFDSDSEDESEVFHFGTKIKGMMTLRGRAAAAAAAAGAPVSAATISGQSRRTVPSVGKEKV